MEAVILYTRLVQKTGLKVGGGELSSNTKVSLLLDSGIDALTSFLLNTSADFLLS